MGTTRFKGETASERLNFESISDSDMIQVRHLPGTLNDADKGISKAQLMSCPFGVCDTAANTALKTVSLADSNPDFVLVSGREVVIYFANANTETSPVINFEGSGSYPLFFDNGSPVGTWAAGTWMHLKFFSVEINDILIQRWILLSPLPVDAVTANNMQSVTSNAVSRAMSYSTEEVNTGKKWINGKDIYSKTYYNVSNFPHSAGLTNVDEITKIKAVAKDVGSNFFSLPFITMNSGVTYFTNIFYNKNDNAIYSDSNSNVESVNITIEYTKTN